MPAPSEVIAAPLTVYLAPVGTAFPAIDANEATILTGGTWQKLGTEGPSNYDESGVSVDHTEQTYDFTPAGRTMPTKRFRTGESFEIKLNLVDVGPDAYALVMNDAAITTVAGGVGVAGTKTFSLYRGDVVNSFALLARGMSSVDNSLNMQYEFSKTFVSVNGTVTFNKGQVAMLPVEIQAVKHADTDLIQVVIQTAAAS